MKWSPSGLAPIALAVPAAVAPQLCAAKVFLSVEQAQKDMFGAATLAATPVVLTAAQQDRLKEVKAGDGTHTSFAFDWRGLLTSTSCVPMTGTTSVT